MGAVRKPAVAGTFYPRDAQQLRSEIETHLAAANIPASDHPPRALIAPHAGYIYSGPVAASAYAAVTPYRDLYRRVVLIGTAHRLPPDGVGLCRADFATPLGRVPIDVPAFELLAQHPHVSECAQAHREEHSLEVQLPFLQVVLSEFTLVPLLVGDASPEQLADVLASLGDEAADLLVVSSDLSHYLSYEAARQLDAQTCTAIEHLEPEGISSRQACGSVPIQALLLLAKQRGLAVVTHDLRNSGDTAGPRDQVVGYGAWVFAGPRS